MKIKSVTKKLDVEGKQVDVSTEIFEDPDHGLTVAEHTAVIGSTTYKARHTIAPNASMTQEQAQADFDAFRQQVAQEAAGKENVRLLAANLV